MDVAAEAGLRYRWTIPGPRPLDILQSIGTGCAFLDYNNDGNLDVLLVGPKLALYKGDGRGHFADVTHQMGLDNLHGHYLGCAVGDYDNDGYDDLYISGYRTGLLLHNDRGRRFTDVTQAAGIKPQPWGTSCTWGDYDNDGKLDLYVGNYVAYDPVHDTRFCSDLGHQTGCGPNQYDPLPGVLYHNEGDGRFRDASSQTTHSIKGKTLGAAFADDGTGRLDLYLANDEWAGSLLKNQPGLWPDVGRRSGTAFDSNYRLHAGMGEDWGDYDNDGLMDLVIGTFNSEPKPVYHNEGGGLFRDISPTLGLAAPTRSEVTFGVKWLDVDNDGWLDLMLVNGHVNDNIRQIDPEQSYRQSTQLFRNDHGRRFINVSAQAGQAMIRPVVGRGLAVGDFDNDGREDTLISVCEGTPVLLHNVGRHTGHWLSLLLVGTESNRDGIGAQVTVETAGLRQVRVCHTDGSYLSSSDKRVHIGLGHSTFASTITIHWPSGHDTVLHHVLCDQEVTVREGRTALSARGA